MFRSGTRTFKYKCIGDSAQRTVEEGLGRRSRGVARRGRVSRGVACRSRVSVVDGCTVRGDVYRANTLKSTNTRDFCPDGGLKTLNSTNTIAASSRRLTRTVQTLRSCKEADEFSFRCRNVGSEVSRVRTTMLGIGLERPRSRRVTEYEVTVLCVSCLRPTVIRHYVPGELLRSPFDGMLRVFPFVARREVELERFLGSRSMRATVRCPVPPGRRLKCPRLQRCRLPVARGVTYRRLDLPYGSAVESRRIVQMTRLVGSCFLQHGLQ